MTKTKSTTKKEKATTGKNVTKRNKPSSKPIKLGGVFGVPNQGDV